jgi:hypothetical protein
MAMQQWEPQIRTNLEDPVYQIHLDRVLEGVPGGIAAALVNTRFQEGCLRLPGRGAGSAAQTGAVVSLLSAWFATDASAGHAGYAEALAPLRPCAGFSLNFQAETLMAARLGDGGRVLVLAVPSTLNLGASLALLHVAEGQMSSDTSALAAALEPSDDVLVGLLVDVRTGTVVDRYERFAGASVIDMGERLVAVLRALFTTDAPAVPLVLYDREDGEPLELRRAEVVATDRRLHCARVPFDPEHVLMLAADKRVAQGLLWTVLKVAETETVRVWVDGLLSYGVPSTMSPFPETQQQFLGIVRELRQLDRNDLLGRLDIGGFANHEVGTGEEMQRCMECIYYLPNGKWCDLPELPVPVEPHWWCRLWKM